MSEEVVNIPKNGTEKTNVDQLLAAFEQNLQKMSGNDSKTLQN
jgi:hypothetical protein